MVMVTSIGMNLSHLEGLDTLGGENSLKIAKKKLDMANPRVYIYLRIMCIDKKRRHNQWNYLRIDPAFAVRKFTRLK